MSVFQTRDAFNAAAREVVVVMVMLLLDVLSIRSNLKKNKQKPHERMKNN